jgi:phosphomevalonate kinase
VIHASAPGKVVLWGEYAVLTGAPGLVLAIDRRASCMLTPGGDTWHFETRGLPEPAVDLDVADLTGPHPPGSSAGALAWHVLRQLDGEVPAGATLTTDTASFQDGGHKLGIGSSAAVCTAVYGAFCKLLGIGPSLTDALAVHRSLQGASGSGIDVAAAYLGGSLRYQLRGAARPPAADPFDLPDGLILRFIWTGTPAQTTRHVARFEAWRAENQTSTLTELAQASAALFESRNLLDDLAEYAECLYAMDRAAGLGIYTDAHLQLSQVAKECKVVYKPCGAGGGDIGVAASHDEHRVEQFVSAALGLGFQIVEMEITEHGIQLAS